MENASYTDMKLHLNQLERPWRMIDKFNFFNSVSNGLLNIRVPSFVKSEAWEQVVDQAHKERFIFVDKFAQVHIAKNSHHNTIFTVLSAENKTISIRCWTREFEDKPCLGLNVPSRA